ncbi:MAG TPA: SRPBCC family protein [Thermoleophilaceae bacterium]|nr:SRPBCC family protein [Thermoleophilaceae bacterium]
MASYEFLTTWLLRAPRPEVWDALQDPIVWPAWWRGVESVVELDGGDSEQVGSRYRVRWRSLVPYPVQFEFEVDRIEKPLLMAGRATGELAGTGTWRLYEQDGLTAVTYDWRVSTTKPWMNFVAPLARPVFEWNHDWVMARGGEGLARRLGVELVALG